MKNAFSDELLLKKNFKNLKKGLFSCNLNQSSYLSQNKQNGEAQLSYIFSNMKDQIYAVGVDYVSENGNTTASVNGCTETSVKIREECKLSCISESLFIKLRKREWDLKYIQLKSNFSCTKIKL